MANSVEANQRHRDREPPIIDWDERIANLHDILHDIYDPDVVISVVSHDSSPSGMTSAGQRLEGGSIQRRPAVQGTATLTGQPRIWPRRRLEGDGTD
jgi:hypothetical protein